jgi:DNA-binding XRE family transcriptional regulator
MNLDELLGIDLDDPHQRLARDLVEADEKMLDELVRIRKEHLTQSQVGEQMGISQGAVARIESGDRDPHLSTLRRYAFAVGAVIKHNVERAETSQRLQWTAGQEATNLVAVAWTAPMIPAQGTRIPDWRMTRVPLDA